MSENVIYGFIDPNTKELRYIGYSNNLKRRIIEHFSPKSLKKKTHKNDWIKSLNGIRPEAIILETYATPEELPQAEIECIEYYKFIGCDLTNHTSGGDGRTAGFKCSEETNEKNRLAQTGRKHSKETKKKIGLASTGRKASEESKKKMSLSKHIDITNKQFGYLIALEHGASYIKNHLELWNCLCTHCGNTKCISKGTLISSHKKNHKITCGCITNEFREKQRKGSIGRPWSEARRKAYENKNNKKM